MSDDVKVVTVPQQDPRLGRQMVHDARSLMWPVSVTVDRSTWKDKRVRIYDPIPNPNQDVGCCTACAKAMQLNALGNSKLGMTLGYEWARNVCYPLNTRLDPWEGWFNPETGVEDTGSSGLASAKAAVQLGEGGTYRWCRNVDEVVQLVQMGWVVSVGTWWYWDMFTPSGSEGRISPTGGQAGGHQYVARGYDFYRDWVLIRCWWGEGYRDVWITRTDLGNLLADGGDAHIQAVAS